MTWDAPSKTRKITRTGAQQTNENIEALAIEVFPRVGT